MKPARVRCAIYTRKSSEEGLDQAFNSLDAQREACAAYVLSQAGEGWTLLKGRYDDGGFSGGNMERPGLTRLLADVDAGLIDVVVVYKVDRLTRSLPDFARIVERLDKASASFVSVTQAFNTTTSMGRLTLNVLLSFAQFEREVTGERIRDKIAMSKAKGMWLGGACPLGYDPPTDRETRALVVNEAEAETVRMIFRRYLELGSVHLLARDLTASGVLSKSRITRTGRSYGGRPLNRGALFHLLKNRTYVGQIVHKGSIHPGLHAPIIDGELFEAVQVKLAERTPKLRSGPVRAAPMPLTGIIFDADGQPMSPTTARGRNPTILYRYYVSTTLQTGRARPSLDKLQRIPADRLHRLVAERLSRLLPFHEEPLWSDMLPALERLEIGATAVRLDVQRGIVAPRARGAKQARDLVSSRLSADDEVMTCPDRPDLLRIVIATRLRLRGGRSWTQEVDGRRSEMKGRPNRTLVRGLREAHAILTHLGAHPELSARTLVGARPPATYADRTRANLALLAPALQASILAGDSAREVTIEQLTGVDMPLAWVDQLQRLRPTWS